jgi:hypothetical protein
VQFLGRILYSSYLKRISQVWFHIPFQISEQTFRKHVPFCQLHTRVSSTEEQKWILILLQLNHYVNFCDCVDMNTGSKELFKTRFVGVRETKDSCDSHNEDFSAGRMFSLYFLILTVVSVIPAELSSYDLQHVPHISLLFFIQFI